MGGGEMSAGDAKVIELTRVTWDEKSPAPVGGTAASRLTAAAVSALPGVADAKAKNKPALVYFTAAEARAGGGCGAAGAGGPQAKACRELDSECFVGGTQGVGLLARFFHRTRVDVRAVAPQQDPVFNALNGPLVLVTASDGSKIALLTGKISKADLTAAMLAALRRSGYNAQSVAAQGDGILSQIRKLEDEKQKLNRLQARCANKVQRAGAQEAAYQQEMSRYKSEAEQVDRSLAEAYRAFEALGKPATVAKAG
jgi:hypothetical protein